MKNWDLNQIDYYNYNKRLVIRLDYFCKRGYIER